MTSVSRFAATVVLAYSPVSEEIKLLTFSELDHLTEHLEGQGGEQTLCPAKFSATSALPCSPFPSPLPSPPLSFSLLPS